MVYRGKPSAGCENCRKAKKRCDLEQPACLRCVKLKKTCSGYRDTTSLQIQDESESVRRKSEKQQARTPSPQPPQQWRQHSSPIQQPTKSKPKSNFLAPPTVTDTPTGIPTPESVHSDSTSSSDSTVDLERQILDPSWSPSAVDFASDDLLFDPSDSSSLLLTTSLMPKPDDIAVAYFFNQFTCENHWSFMRLFAAERTLDPCLDLAIRACGMAALGNVQVVAGGKQYARSMYTAALGLLNDALRDPQRSKTDESLIAVAMLSRFENLTCDGRDSIQSWKAHIKGSTQLLKVRGKSQFSTHIGRMLFREMRAQAMINAIWEDEYVPPFFRDFQDELDTYQDEGVFNPIDNLTKICFDLADLRAQIRLAKILPAQAVQQASELETRFIQWAIETSSNELWRYTEQEVKDSEHVWDGKVYSFRGLSITPTIWLTYFNMRIMLSRVQEGLCRQIQFSAEEREEQTLYFRRTRRQMTDAVCATVPVSLGHSSPAYSSPCVLITAYGALWPLFFAGTCALERTGPAALSICRDQPLPSGQTYGIAATQAQWILGRLKYISQKVGLKWADGVAATLRGEFMVPEHLVEEDNRRPVPKLGKDVRAGWLRKAGKRPLSTAGTPTETPAIRDGVPWVELVRETVDSTRFAGQLQADTGALLDIQGPSHEFVM
ncbi:uncharacterized protein LTR77_000771 [Saxophila tyrrhenica]|uniref:Zn(2)-C6 fungal-type domain-containing protein n=1 Tax=Saxophila tyrrhenica TaxID=1690608 RepID=A0AAV9PS39_9PEZI|nr:hypothetical protein LTR77_000771 [Saxophila tyrrhenica]